MTNEERTAALQDLGYGEIEARFLVLAALHSGYFLRRQYLQFASALRGRIDDALIQKLQQRRHCRATAFSHRHSVYLLCSKPFFTSIGEENNRNRREKQPPKVKTKLMGFDFVLEHPNRIYLATEREKVDYFTKVNRVPVHQLPARSYFSPRTGKSTTRYFVDKFPIFIEEPASAGAGVTFCYIDDGLVSTDAFETYLTQYARLFAALPSYRVIYMAARPRLFSDAERVFRSPRNVALNGSGHLVDRSVLDLIAYFRMRAKWEARDFAGLEKEDIIRYRKQKKQFAASRFNDLYQRWRAEGEAAVEEQQQPKLPFPPPSSGRFETHLLRHEYDLFSTLQ